MDGFSRDDPSATPHPADLKQPTDLPTALADLRASGWESVSVAEEMRRNTARAIAAASKMISTDTIGSGIQSSQVRIMARPLESDSI